MKQRSLDDGKFWGDDDWWLDQFEDSEVGSNALLALCEANVAGATLPPDVVAFMAQHRMVHDDECADKIIDDTCQFDESDLGVNDLCELAAMLCKWDIRTAFASDSL